MIQGHVSRARNAAGSIIRASTSRSPPQSSPYICTRCQALSQTMFFTTRPPSRRLSSITARRQPQQPQRPQSQSADSNPPSHHKSTAPQPTHYDFFPQTFPTGAPPYSPFTPDLKRLRQEFLRLQAKAHPDVAAAEQKRAAEALSMRINEAYRTLQDPLQRARYLLAQAGIDVEDESTKLAEADGELLMEVMEAREAVDEVREEEELGPLREENDARVGKSMRVLEGAFAKGDLNGAAREAVRLRYWMNIEESIIGWEKGVGGGLVHH